MQNYTEQILVRLKKGQNEILKQEASKYHLPVSSYVRLLLFKEETQICSTRSGKKYNLRLFVLNRTLLAGG